MIGSIDDVIRNAENGTYDFTDHGICSGCGNCCSNLLPMTDAEVTTIRRYIAKHGIKPQEHKAYFLSDPVMDMTCPFMDDSRTKDKCTIYPVRPQICKSFNCHMQSRGIPPRLTGALLRARPMDVRHTFF